jgi:hypothetical protein
MSRTITGEVRDSKGAGVYGAKIHVTSNTGKKLYANNMGAISDMDGKFTLNLPTETPKIERWIAVYDPTTTQKTTAKIKDTIDNYILDDINLGGQSQMLEEVVIKANRPKPKKKKKNYTPIFIIGGSLLALLLGYLVYDQMKEK